MESLREPSADSGLVEVRYWAAIRAAAGVPAERVPAGSLAAVLASARLLHPQARFTQVLGICAVLVDEQPVGARAHADIDVSPGAVVDLLPPFAGGAVPHDETSPYVVAGLGLSN